MVGIFSTAILVFFDESSCRVKINRKRPKMFYDLVSFSFTPIVHDSSDFGVLNTPETIPYILKTLKNSEKFTFQLCIQTK